MRKLLLLLTFVLASAATAAIAQQPETSGTNRKEITEIVKEPDSTLIMVHTTASDRREDVFIMVEDMPRFDGGGLPEFAGWVMSNVQYPEKAVNEKIGGRVIASFIIEKTGALSTVEILSSPDTSLSEEVVRVLLTSPDWSPGRQNGKEVSVKLIIPINFVVPEQPATTSPSCELLPEDGITMEDPAPLDEMPKFKGRDIMNFHSWISSRLEYPSEIQLITDTNSVPEHYVHAMTKNPIEVTGLVTATFVIEKDGSLTNISILKSPDVRLSHEVIRVLKMSPKWDPGMIDGKPVRVRFTLPVEFAL